MMAKAKPASKARTNGSNGRRRSKAVLTESVTVMVAKSTRRQLDREAREEGITFSEAVRAYLPA